MKVGLGTVQFGLDYGISNPEGKTSREEVARVLEVARNCGINLIDTAALYGNSEEALGISLPQNHSFRLVTKTVRIGSKQITSEEADLLESTFLESLRKLCSQSIYGLMIHNAEDLLTDGGERLLDRMVALKQKGLVTKVGVSVYTPEQIDKILDRFEIDLIQLPMNVLDQRLLEGGQLAALKAQGVEVHVRSAFLQGLLLMNPETFPPYFDSVRQHFIRYHEFLRDNCITPIEAALGFVSGLDHVDAIICGVNNHMQLEEICSSCNPLPQSLFSEFALSDTSILDPSKWNTC